MEYRGYWRNDKREGFGKLIHPDGRTYEGEWVLGRMNGRGKMIYANGFSYEGEFHNDMKQGDGVRQEWLESPYVPQPLDRTYISE